MNGATEATLADLLAVASAMNINLIKLQGLIGKMSGPTSSGSSSPATGVAGFAASLTPAGAALGVLRGAAGAVGAVLGALGNILGKVISGFVNTGKNLFEFGIAAANGTAKLSDLYNAFKDLPFFIGSAMELFADLIKYQEGLLKSYQDITKAGADFSGNLFQMREMAYKSYMSLAEFGKVVKTNSDIFATAIGGVDAGIRKFTDVQNKLFSDGKLSKQILGLGLTAEDAGEYIGLYMRMQGNLGKMQNQTAEQTAQGVAGLVVELDSFAKLTGQNREVLEKQMKEAAADENLKSFLSNLSGDELVRAQAELAKGFEMAGKGGRDYYAQVMMTNGQMLGPTTKAMADAFTQTSGKITNAALLSYHSVKNFAIGSKESLESTIQQRNLIGSGFREFRDLVGAGTLGVMHGLGQIEQNAAIAKTSSNKTMTTAEQIAKKQQEQYEGNAAELSKAQLQIKMFGAALGEKFLKFIEPFGPILTQITDLLLNGLGTAVTALTKKDGPLEEMTKALDKVVKWATDTFKYLSKSDSVSNFWDRMGVVLENAWNTIKPYAMKVWDGLIEFIKPQFKRLMEMFSDEINAFKYSLPGGSLIAESPVDRAKKREMQYASENAQSLVTDIASKIDNARSRGDTKEVSVLQQQLIAATSGMNTLINAYGLQQSGGPRRGYASGNQTRHTGTLGMTGSWWEKKDATLSVQAGESVVTPGQMAQLTGQNGVAEGIQQLNSLTAQLLSVMKQNTDYTQRNYNATRELGGNLFATI